jgi:hypothetical protein
MSEEEERAKERARESKRKYELAHREEHKAKGKAYYKAHVNERKEYRRAHIDEIKRKDHLRYLKNREKKLAQAKAYHEAHKPEREEYRQAYYRANRPALRAKSLAYRKSHPTARRDHELKTMYGWTRADYDRLLTEQRSVCAICGGKDWGGKWNKPQIDHDHATGKPRGILCANCNTTLGLINDDRRIAQAMLDYLKKFTRKCEKS